MPRLCGSGTSSGVTSSGPDRGERVEGLAGHPLLARLVELPVARRDVVADRVAADVLERLLPGMCLPASADHHHQLGLVVDLVAHRGQDDRTAVADQGGRILAEEDRLGRRRHAALGGVVAIVQSDADDLARVGHGRQ